MSEFNELSMEELELTEGGVAPWVPIIIVGVGVIAFGVGAYNGFQSTR